MKVLGQENDPAGRQYSTYSATELSELLESADFPASVVSCPVKPINRVAKKVEVGEIGFTGPGHLSIGSDQITDCVTLAVRDPDSSKIGYTHLNDQYDFSSLDLLFAGFAHRPLEVKILGANGSNLEVSGNNLRLLCEYLLDKEVDIIAASVMGMGRPDVLGRRVVRAQTHEVVIDADTFEMRAEQLWDSRSPEALLSTAKACLAEAHSSLYTVFDFTRSNARAPIQFTAKEVSDLKDVAGGRNRHEIFSALEARDMPVSWAGVMATALYELEQQHAVALKPLIRALDARLDSIGLNSTNELRTAAINLISKAPIHIGGEETAGLANQPLIELITNGLIVATEDSRSKINVDLLNNFCFPDSEPFELAAITAPAAPAERDAGQHHRKTSISLQR